jgi:hypothetical protein
VGFGGNRGLSENNGAIFGESAGADMGRSGVAGSCDRSADAEDAFPLVAPAAATRFVGGFENEESAAEGSALEQSVWQQSAAEQPAAQESAAEDTVKRAADGVGAAAAAATLPASGIDALESAAEGSALEQSMGEPSAAEEAGKGTAEGAAAGASIVAVEVAAAEGAPPA